MKHIIFLCITAVTVSGCTPSRSNFASQARKDGGSYLKLAHKWEKGETMVKKGRSLIAKGNSHEEGGELLVQQGEILKLIAETNYQFKKQTIQ